MISDPVARFDFAGRILGHAWAYRLWQAPFAERKMRPLYRQSGGLHSARRVLDVGCGPGTNTVHFAHADYVGLDIDPRYVEFARRRYGRDFVVADATTYTFPDGSRFDFILLNSFLHHVNEDDARRVLDHLATLVTDEGHVHILDVVLPSRPSLARWLARADRGKFVRPIDHWRELFERSFEPVAFEPFCLNAIGVPLWNMIYFKGRARR